MAGKCRDIVRYIYKSIASRPKPGNSKKTICAFLKYKNIEAFGFKKANARQYNRPLKQIMNAGGLFLRSKGSYLKFLLLSCELIWSYFIKAFDRVVTNGATQFVVLRLTPSYIQKFYQPWLLRHYYL